MARRLAATSRDQPRMTQSALLRHPSACSPAPVPTDVCEGMRFRWTRLHQRLTRRANPYPRHSLCNMAIHKDLGFLFDKQDCQI